MFSQRLRIAQRHQKEGGCHSLGRGDTADRAVQVLSDVEASSYAYVRRSMIYYHIENRVSVFLVYVMLQKFAGYIVSYDLHSR